jgi:hypothetical protein
MKKLLFLLFVLITSSIFSQQVKKELSQAEKSFIGKWSFTNTEHIMKKEVPGSENVTTMEFQKDLKFVSYDKYTLKGKELVTSIENGDWKISGDKLILHFSGKFEFTKEGKALSTSKNRQTDIVKIYSENKKNSVKDNNKPRTIEYFQILFQIRKELVPGRRAPHRDGYKFLHQPVRSAT